MKLNKERTGCGLYFESPCSHNELTKKMNKVADCISEAFVPSNVSWEGEEYYFYVGHRESLKEYIYENGFSVKDFFTFVRALDKLMSKAEQYNINIYEFVFNYECIFVGGSLSELEFIYAPDKAVYKDKKLVNNKCSDMAAIISLHIEYNDYERSGYTAFEVAQIVLVLSKWEEKHNENDIPFPHEELSKYICDKKTILVYIEPFLKKITGRVNALFKKIFIKKEGIAMRLKGKMLLKGIEFSENEKNPSVVNIGRDKEWADIELGMIYVSRKHATVYKNEDNWYVKDLNSTNGTFVDGVRIVSELPFSLKNGCEISFGVPESKFIFYLL